MGRDDLIALVASIQRGEGTEEAISNKVDLFLANVADPNAADLIFWQDLTPEQVVDRAMAYKPICL